jgi:hypothetical protein
MALTVPNLDRTQKADPKLGEAIQRIQKYVNLNTSQAPGNRVPKPPIDSTSVKT